MNFIQTVIAQFNPPSPSVPTWFTKELTELGGYADNGKDPQLRIVWGGSATQFWEGRERIKYPKFSNKFPIGWEVVNEKGERELLPLQKEDSSVVSADNKELGVGRIVYDWVDIGQPFFIIEEWFAPEVACRGWQQSRYKWDSSTNTFIDRLGPEPTNGLYQRLFTLRTDKFEYMEPNQAAMTYIKAMLWLQRQEPALYSKTERPPSFVVERELRKKYAEIEANEVKFEEKMADMMMERVRRSILNPTSYAPASKGQIIVAHK